jgi:hypothetical protein
MHIIGYYLMTSQGSQISLIFQVEITADTLSLNYQISENWQQRNKHSE